MRRRGSQHYGFFHGFPARENLWQDYRICEGTGTSLSVFERISVDARKLTQRQSSRKVQARSVIVLLPGVTNEYLQSPCIIIPIEKDGLPTRMTTRDGKIVTVDWDAGRAWEVLQDVRLASVDKKGGTLLVLRAMWAKTAWLARKDLLSGFCMKVNFCHSNKASGVIRPRCYGLNKYVALLGPTCIVPPSPANLHRPESHSQVRHHDGSGW